MIVRAWRGGFAAGLLVVGLVGGYNAAAHAQDASATIRPVKSIFRAIDGIEIDVDARSLTAGSNRRLIIVPRGTPDAVTDVNAFVEASVSVQASKARLWLPPAAAGANEIRLLFIPTFETQFVVAARAPIQVLPGTPGAILAHQLLDEVNSVGAVAFENKYQRTVTIEGQFLSSGRRDYILNTNTAIREEIHKPNKVFVVTINVGRPELQPRRDRAISLVCESPFNDDTARRVMELSRGDAVLITGLVLFRSELHGASISVGAGGQCAFKRSSS
jgi:hypothetical protein